MGTYYLIDFENVHNDGISNIENMTKEDHVHVFSTQNATNIRQDIFWLNGDIKSHLVPARKQSLDMHLVSYLGYLLGVNGKESRHKQSIVQLVQDCHIHYPEAIEVS